MKPIKERIYEYWQPVNEENEEQIRVTGQWIIDNYYNSWREKVEKNPYPLVYSEEDCILDFIAENWAWEIEENEIH